MIWFTLVFILVGVLLWYDVKRSRQGTWKRR